MGLVKGPVGVAALAGPVLRSSAPRTGGQRSDERDGRRPGGPRARAHTVPTARTAGLSSGLIHPRPRASSTARTTAKAQAETLTDVNRRQSADLESVLGHPPSRVRIPRPPQASACMALSFAITFGPLSGRSSSFRRICVPEQVAELVGDGPADGRGDVLVPGRHPGVGPAHDLRHRPVGDAEEELGRSPRCGGRRGAGRPAGRPFSGAFFHSP